MSEEVHYCPSCGTPLDDYCVLEGGWCPKCKEWYPADIVQEREWENE